MPILEPVTPQARLHAFAGYGIELEYIIVDRKTLAVRPLADRLLVDDSGEVVNEIAHGPVAWSNELVSHVIEFKTNGPASGLDGLAEAFGRAVVEANRRLEQLGAMLMPTAMHPFFDPAAETELWPYGQNEIYQAYDRIFGCAGHGWSNLQSVHVNLPFANDQEFRRLHAAIRVVLPLIPALAASSPMEQGRLSGWSDRRLCHYRGNQARIPEIAGLGVPEPVDSIADYHQRILAPMYAAIAPHDPDDILADDWLNSRGAIARFERQTIEIRLIDIQECPAADLAVASAVVALVRRLYQAGAESFDRQQALDTRMLSSVLFEQAEHGGSAMIEDSGYLAVLGLPGPTSGLDAWRRLAATGLVHGSSHAGTLQRLLSRGALSEAIVGRLGPSPGRQAVVDCYRELCACLHDNRLFQP